MKPLAQTLTLRPAVLAVTVLLVTAGAVGAQNPSGTEFRVNTYTTGTQRFGSIAANEGYLFFVTWESAGQDGSQYGVFGQRYEGFTPAPLGGEFQINTYTTSDQSSPEVASDPAGHFVVVWQSAGQDGDGLSVFGQRYSSAGVPLGGEFRVNTFTTLAQGFADVAANAGGFMVVWQSAGQDGSGYGVFGQRYSSTGTPLGGEFRVNTYTTGAQRAPAVAVNSGGFVVVWESFDQDANGYGIFGQRYASTGTPLGGEFRVNTYTTGNQRSPAVDGPIGEFAVVWQSDGQDGSSDGVFGQRYASTGTPAGPEFSVNTYTTSSQSSPALSVDAVHQIITVLWQSDLQDGSDMGIYSRKFLGGFPSDEEIQVNDHTAGPQTGPGMAFGGWPRWISPWTSPQDPDGSLGVYAMMWYDLPVELQTFTVE